MKFFVVFFMVFLLLENNALARLISRSNEDAPSLKQKKRTSTSPDMSKVSSEKDRANAGGRATSQQGKARSSRRKGHNQGQAVSTAYDKADFTISVDIDGAAQESDMAENAFSAKGDGGSDGTDKMTSQSTYSTSVSLTGAKAISASALNRAKAADALKKKLQAENKKKFQLQDVSGESSKGDPRQDIINKLVEASQDIEK